MTPIVLVLEVRVREDQAVEVVFTTEDGEPRYGPVTIDQVASVLDMVAATGRLPVQ